MARAFHNPRRLCNQPLSSSNVVQSLILYGSRLPQRNHLPSIVCITGLRTLGISLCSTLYITNITDFLHTLPIIRFSCSAMLGAPSVLSSYGRGYIIVQPLMLSPSCVTDPTTICPFSLLSLFPTTHSTRHLRVLPFELRFSHGQPGLLDNNFACLRLPAPVKTPTSVSLSSANSDFRRRSAQPRGQDCPEGPTLLVPSLIYAAHMAVQSH